MEKKIPDSWRGHLRGWRFALHVIKLTNYQWFRRFVGGKWELWWVDSPVCSYVWHDVLEFSRVCGERPPLCRGTVTEENWS
jgi:hypothetical protein